MKIPNRQRKQILDREIMASRLRRKVMQFDERMLKGLMEGVHKIAESGTARVWVDVNYPTITEKAMVLDRRKALSNVDRQFFLNLFAKYDMTSEAEEFRKEIDNVNIDTYDKAANFALKKLNIINVKFGLTNPYLIDKLKARSDTFPESSKVTFENSIDTIQKRFIDQGLAPYDAKFFRDIQRDLEYQYEYEAIRYARSETGHIQSSAQFELYGKNGVEGKEWTTATFGVRPTHQDVVIMGTARKYGRMDEMFQVGLYAAQYPLDSSLGPEEFCNCRCDIMPYFFDDYKVPDNIWAGE